ncbi:MAG: winged helix DNA-binding domain-containing protein, partial [Mucilaginibacter sp.]
MTARDIIRLRLYVQHLSRQQYKNPGELVGYLGAVQAQDYAGAKWAMGLRLTNAKDSVIEKAMTAGDILRTHVLRPTWHFVTPKDIRWMIELTAPRIKQMSVTRNRQLKLDAAIFKKSNDILAKALGGGQLTRSELSEKLEEAGIKTGTERLVHLLMTAELDCVITSGAKQGKQFTYALFDDRVPNLKRFKKEEAVAKLAKRYFNSRGPATLHDFAWWSGLTQTDAKTGLEEIKKELVSINIKGATYWMPPHIPDIILPAAATYLLPAYDEFTIAYKDRSAAINIKHTQQAGYMIFDP